jgi:tetratricopeptide (TPR) repeat protein
MDWGLAKVLKPGGVAEAAPPAEATAIRTARSGSEAPAAAQTQAGTVLGTPAYMAPEQARGAAERLDARCDVFGLGAMLCHILTGQPPFRGGSEEALRQAQAAELAAAFARLDGCGADAELVALTKRCLSADPAGRPPDAGALAAELSAYLESVEARLRRAELERGQAQVKAAEERKRRKVQLALAAALLLLVVGGGAGGWLWQQQRQAAAEAAARRQREADAAVALLTAEARLLRTQARAAPRADSARLREARSAARQAAELARANEASEDAARQAAQLAEALEAEVTAAGRDGRLLAALLEVRGPREGPRFQRDDRGLLLELAEPSAGKQFQAAFRDWGLDVDAVPEAAAVARLQARPAGVVVEVVAALDEWASERRVRRMPAKACQRLARLAQALDSGAGARRRELREMLARGGLAREQALALHPVQILFDGDWGKDHVRLSHLAATTDAAVEPTLGLLTLVRALQVAGDDHAGEGLLRAALRARPGDVVLHHALGQMLTKQRRWPEAVECYTAARALRPELGVTLAGALVNAGRVGEGLSLFERLIAERRDNPSPWLYIRHGDALNGQGRHKEAEAAFREAVRLKPDYRVAHCNLGIALERQGRHKEAEAAYRQAIRIKPELPEAHNGLGVALQHQDRQREAEAAYRQAIRIKPDFPIAHNNLGAVLNAQGRQREAEAACRLAIRLRDDYPEAHYNLGKALAGLGRPREAEAAFREATRLKHNFPMAHCDLGTAIHAQGRFREAEAAFREATRLKHDYPEAHNRLGIALNAQGRPREAEPAFREAINLKSDSAGYHYNLGVTLMRQGRHREAAAALREAVRLKQDDPEAHHRLGLALGNQGQYEAAVAAFREAIRLKHVFADAHSNLGNALNSLARYQEAEVSCRQAIRLYHDFPEAHINLGVALRNQGRFPDALEAFRRGDQLGRMRRGWPHPSAAWVTECERLVELDRKLPAVVEGKARPATAAEGLELASLCRHPARRLHATAARLSAAAFADDPKRAGNLQQQYRYNAACSAALAAAGLAEDARRLPEKERVALRRQALDWLRADLAAYDGLAASDDPRGKAAVRQRLAHWQQDGDFAGVRDPDALAKLPEAERAAWQRLWADVAALRTKAEGKGK